MKKSSASSSHQTREIIDRESHPADRHAGKGLRIEEYHHPLWAIFAAYPSAVKMELRMMEELLGSRLVRREIAATRSTTARVEFWIPTI
jgi:predicted ArsR family transcriptional regulator